jgi:hypothetical protein
MTVSELGRDGNWIKILMPDDAGTEGWIHSRMLKENGPAANPQ